MRKQIMTVLMGAALALMLVAGCATKLESGGAYTPATTNAVTGAVTVANDKAFFAVDSAFELAYSAVNTTFDFERNNRALLWQISPEIKHALDKARPQAKAAVMAYALARRAYKKNPTPGGLSTLQTALGRMQQVATAAQAALPKQ